jgi:hypothetical protein
MIASDTKGEKIIDPFDMDYAWWPAIRALSVFDVCGVWQRGVIAELRSGTDLLSNQLRFRWRARSLVPVQEYSGRTTPTYACKSDFITSQPIKKPYASVVPHIDVPKTNGAP